MSFFNWLGNRRTTAGRTGAGIKPRSLCRPEVESLEDRMTPAKHSAVIMPELGATFNATHLTTKSDTFALHGSGESAAKRAASNTTSRPIAGRGAGAIVSAEGGFYSEGTATHLGAFKHYGDFDFAPTADPGVLAVRGVAVYEAANGDILDVSVVGTLNAATGVASGTATWHGGTGRFAAASGNLHVTAQFLPDGSFTFRFNGAIKF